MEASSTEKRIDDLADRVGRFEDRFVRFEDKVDARFGLVDERFDQVDERFNAVGERINGLATKEELQEIVKRLDSWGKTITGGVMAVVVVVVGAVILKFIGL
jgi:archaellum component FlaC